MIRVILYDIVFVFFVLLIIRMVVDSIRMFAHSWDPARPLKLALGLVYVTTDPPIDALGKVLPRPRLGGITIDLGFTVTFVIVVMLLSILSVR